MIDFFKRLWGAAPIATVILAFSFATSLFFGARVVAHWIYWHDPAHHEQQIAAWMTPGYIGNSWKVPKEVIIEALDAPEPPPDGVRNLADLAEYHGVTVEEMIDHAEKGIAAFRAEYPAPDGRTP
ncbi:MAG: hypothetical protein ACR2Q4_06015 [Geminicoccaceae bacterium]